MIIATGADYRRIEAEGRENFEGMGVYYAATAMEATPKAISPIRITSTRP